MQTLDRSLARGAWRPLGPSPPRLPLPAPGDRVAVVVAEPALEARRRAHLPTPDREGVLSYLPYVLEGDTPERSRPLVAEEVGPQVVVLLVVAHVLGAHDPAADVVDLARDLVGVAERGPEHRWRCRLPYRFLLSITS